jgi:hypothetical protein
MNPNDKVGILRNRTALQLIQNKYFVRNFPVLNILQTPGPPKSLHLNNLATRYPQDGGGGGHRIETRPKYNQ